MTSPNNNNNSPIAQVLPNPAYTPDEENQPQSFDDIFQQLMSVQICCSLWLTVVRTKSTKRTCFVDIRKKKERISNGGRTYTPTKSGVFLRSNEYDEVKDKLMSRQPGADILFDFEANIGRRVFAHPTADGGCIIKLRTPTKEASLTLTFDEINKLTSFNIPKSVYAAMPSIGSLWN